MLYVVLATADLAKTAPKIGFSRHKNRHNRSRLVRQVFISSACHCGPRARLTFESRKADTVFTLGPKEGGPPAQRPIARYRRQ
jgi:hypothetical protein